jgi:hypothetical protein
LDKILLIIQITFSIKPTETLILEITTQLDSFATAAAAVVVVVIVNMD